jgi:hypothetical protein
VPRPVKGVDRGLDDRAEPAQHLAGVAPFQEREVLVNLRDLGSDRRVLPLARPGEVLVQRPWGQLPRHDVEEPADLDDRLHQSAQRRRRESGDVPGPAVLREGVLEQIPLGLRRGRRCGATLQGQDVRQALLRPDDALLMAASADEPEAATPGIRHRHANYGENSWNLRVTGKIPLHRVESDHTPLTSMNSHDHDLNAVHEPVGTPPGRSRR